MTKSLLDMITDAAEDTKARDVVTIDLEGKTTVAEYFVVCEGDTDRQVRAIADRIVAACRKEGRRPLHVAGADDGAWICLDFDAIVVHVFLPGERSFYDIEGLWALTPRSEQAV